LIEFEEFDQRPSNSRPHWLFVYHSQPEIMNALLAVLLLQLSLQNAGFVTGVARGADGKPAPGVRVRAIALRDAAEAANVPSAFESLTQTDESGRYRLEITPGRYYIASGSVTAPAYYPGTTELTSARAVAIAAGAVVEGVDFSSFVPASRTPTGLSLLPPGSTGVVSGVIRFPDGTPAQSIVALASSAVTRATSSGTILFQSVAAYSQAMALFTRTQTGSLFIAPSGATVTLSARTDAGGRYRIENLPPDTYYLVAGFAEAPALYPGAPDIQTATKITTTPTTKLDSPDFTIPPLPPTTSVSGRVTARLWRDASLRGDGRAWFEILVNRYSEPHRHYHTLHHIAECLDEFDPVRHLASQPVAVELAIWFHDVIYDTHAADNEEQSALLAEQCLSEAGAGMDTRLAVWDLVLSTRTRDATTHVDAPLLVDVDLSILGKKENRFRECESQIRQEYSWVPDAIFAAKRAEILEGFLTRDRIFSTDWFFQACETHARANLQASLARLRNSGSGATNTTL
jgi:predicted metal-dependent HD superfamily phosphohydrolase